MDVLEKHCAVESRREQRSTVVCGGGIETHLIYRRGIPLRQFAAWDAVFTPEGRAALREWSKLMIEAGSGAEAQLLHAPLWRASSAWTAPVLFEGNEESPETVCRRLQAALEDLTSRPVDGGALEGITAAAAADWASAEISRSLLHVAREAWNESQHSCTSERTVLIVAECGPLDDGYSTADPLPAPHAAELHSPQLLAVKGHCDVAVAYTIPSVAELIGWATAAAAADIPYLLSPTIEPDGRLPDGTYIGDAVAETLSHLREAGMAPPLGFLVNCMHPSHLLPHLERDNGKEWVQWLCGARVNASALTHAELDALDSLEDGDASSLAASVRQLHRLELRLLGGCCGTDERHISAIVSAVNEATH